MNATKAKQAGAAFRLRTAIRLPFALSILSSLYGTKSDCRTMLTQMTSSEQTRAKPVPCASTALFEAVVTLPVKTFFLPKQIYR